MTSVTYEGWAIPAKDLTLHSTGEWPSGDPASYDAYQEYLDKKHQTEETTARMMATYQDRENRQPETAPASVNNGGFYLVMALLFPVALLFSIGTFGISLAVWLFFLIGTRTRKSDVKSLNAATSPRPKSTEDKVIAGIGWVSVIAVSAFSIVMLYVLASIMSGG